MASAVSTMPHLRVASLLPWAVEFRYRPRRAVASLLTTLLGVAMAGRGKSTGTSGFTHGSDARCFLIVVLQPLVLAQLACARTMPRMYLPRLLVHQRSAPDSFGHLSLIEALICSSTDRINIYPKRLRHLPSRYFFLATFLSLATYFDCSFCRCTKLPLEWHPEYSNSDTK